MSEQEMIKGMLRQDLTSIDNPNFNRQVLQEYRRRKAEPKSPLSMTDERLIVTALIVSMPIALFSLRNPNYALPVILLALVCIPLMLIGLDLTHRRLSKHMPTNL